MPSKKCQLNRAALRFGKGSHEGANFFRAPGLVDVAFGIGTHDGGRKNIGIRIFAAALLFALQAQKIERAVAGHREEPRLERPARNLKPVRAAPELQKNVLHDFFGRRGMLGDAQNQGIHRPAVAVVEGLESAGVALQNAFHQDSVGRLFALGPGLDDCKQQNSVPFPFLSKYGETARLDELRPSKPISRNILLRLSQ